MRSGSVEVNAHALREWDAHVAEAASFLIPVLDNVAYSPVNAMTLRLATHYQSADNPHKQTPHISTTA